MDDCFSNDGHFTLWHWIKVMMLFPNILLLLFCQETLARDVLPQKELYLPDYSIYHNLSKIQQDVRQIASKNPHIMKVNFDYVSRQSIAQPVIRITDFSVDSKTKVKILFSFGEHAREFLPIESMFYLIKNLTSTVNHDSISQSFASVVLKHVDLYLIAIVNPDGRKYIEENGNYCWRGTSNGVDLNRNFDWNYAGKGSSGNPKDEEYRGTHVFSEPECKVLQELTEQHKFDLFISFHSGIKQIYIPFADSLSKQMRRKPGNIDAMVDLAKKLANSVSVGFKYGHALELTKYTADGTVFDFMAGKRKIPFSYAVELWGVPEGPDNKCFDLFNPENQNLQQVVKDLHPFYEELFLYMINWKADQQKQGEIDALELESTSKFEVRHILFILSVIAILLFLVQFHRLFHIPCSKFYQRRRVVSLRSLSSTFTYTSLVKSS